MEVTSVGPSVRPSLDRLWVYIKFGTAIAYKEKVFDHLEFRAVCAVTLLMSALT